MRRRRVKRLEDRAGGSLYGFLLSVGIERERARELIGPDGHLHAKACTDEELDKITAEGFVVAGRIIPTEEVTDAQLERLIEGERPAEVLQGLL